MDPSNMDPCFNSTNFMDLLHSQQQIPGCDINIPLDVDNASSQVREGRVAESTSRVERRKWTPLEDVVLCSSWLNTSKDAVVGNEQKHTAFWKRVGALFNASPKLEGYQKRDANNCKQRWQKMNDQVCKFVGCFETAKRQQTSGQNEDDIVRLAYEIFYQDHKSKFNLEHVWMELRNDQKWCSSNSRVGSGSNKRSRDDAFCSSNTTKECDEQESRPVGVKASKRKGKGIVKNDGLNKLEQFQQAWNVKEREYERKEKVAKLDLLHGLISKKELLSDIEIALKDKLIHDMLL